MARVSIGPVTDVPESSGISAVVGNRRLAVFRVGAEVFAIDDVCAHRGFPLHDGLVRDGTVTCRTHRACFDLKSGSVLRGPARRPIRSYPAEIVDDEIIVEMPE